MLRLAVLLQHVGGTIQRRHVVLREGPRHHHRAAGAKVEAVGRRHLDGVA